LESIFSFFQSTDFSIGCLCHLFGFKQSCCKLQQWRSKFESEGTHRTDELEEAKYVLIIFRTKVILKYVLL
jgi:hypothetical protein